MNIYVEKFLNSNCAADILPLFTNYTQVSKRNKEISESMSCLDAALRYSGFDPKDPDVFCYVVGDGIRPRTGMLVAYFTQWNVLSIDPVLDMDWWENYHSFKANEGFAPQRLALFRRKIEDMSLEENEKSVIILPHSHADLGATLVSIPGKSSIIELPCCTNFHDKLRSKKAVEHFGYMSYMDFDILSPKRTMHIWKNIDLDGYYSLIK